jgi:hypothetical protein
MQGLWIEFEEGKSREAVAVRDLDKYEMVVSALEYEQGVNLQGFVRFPVNVILKQNKVLIFKDFSIQLKVYLNVKPLRNGLLSCLK